MMIDLIYPLAKPCGLGRWSLWSLVVSMYRIVIAAVFFCLGTAGGLQAEEPEVRVLEIRTGDMVYDATRGWLWLSVRAASPVHANRVIAIDPVTMGVERTIQVGSDPLLLALSDDDQILYVSLQGAPGYHRIHLEDDLIGPRFSLGTLSGSDLYVNDMQVLPGNPNAVAISARTQAIDSSFQKLAVYEGDAARPDQIGADSYSIHQIAFSSDSSLLLGFSEDPPYELHRMEVDENGVRHLDATVGIFTTPMAGVQPGMRYFDGRVVSVDGVVADPHNLQIAGFLPSNELVRDTILDPDLGKFFMAIRWGLHVQRVVTYDADTFAELKTFTISDGRGWPEQIVRWGPRGLAMRTGHHNLIVFEGDLVAPAETEADLRVEVIIPPEQRVIEEAFSYRVRLTNAGPDTATSVVLSHEVPWSFTVLEATAGDGEVTLENRNLSVEWETLEAGEVRDLTIQAVGSSAGRLRVDATVETETGIRQPSSVQTEGWIHVNPGVREHSVLSERSLRIIDMVMPSGSSLLYASIDREDPLYGSRVIAIDPSSGEVVEKFSVGASPARLAASGDGRYLYVAAQDGYNVKRIDLETGEVDLSHGLMFDSDNRVRSMLDMAVLPGDPDSIAISLHPLSNPYSLVVLNSGVMRPEMGSYLQRVTSLAVNDTGSTIYGLQESSRIFRRFSVGPTGVTHLDSANDLFTGPSHRLTYFDGRVYSNVGTIVNAGDLTVAGVFGEENNARKSVALLPELNRALFLRDTGEIESFVLDSTDPVATWNIPHVGTARAPLIVHNGNRMAFAREGSLILLESGIADNERANLALEVENEPVDMRVGMSWTSLARVTNEGDVRVTDLQIDLQRINSLTLVRVESTMGTVTSHFGRFEVFVESLEPGETVEVTVTVRPSLVRSYGLWIGVTTFEEAEDPSVLVKEYAFESKPQGELTIDIPDEATEGDGVLEAAGTVTLGEPELFDAIVLLSSSVTSRLVVPGSVTVPAGDTSATFDLEIVDNDRLDGSRSVNVTGQMAGFASDSVSIIVHDNDSAVITIDVPENVQQGDTVTGRIFIDRPSHTTFMVELSTEHPEWVTLPETVALWPGSMPSVEFSVKVSDALPPLDGQIVSLSASVPGWTDGSAEMLVMPPPPGIPFNPFPLSLSRFASTSPTLSWNEATSMELIVNGRFSSGDFRGWEQVSTGDGGWAMNDGTYDPPGPVGPQPPLSDGFNAVSYQTGPGTNTLFQEVLLPHGVETISLSWADRIYNSGADYSANAQEFRVEVHEVDGAFGKTIFATEPGHPLISSWRFDSGDLTEFQGEHVVLEFIETDSNGYLNVFVDNVSVVAHFPDDTSIDEDIFEVYLGKTPYLGPEDLFQVVNARGVSLDGLEPETTYYWQVVVRRGEQTASSPVWSFRTAAMDVVITAPEGPTVNELLVFDVAFSEPVVGLSVDDFVIHNAAEAWLSGEGAEYTLSVVPAEYGEVSAYLPADTVRNGEGGGNAASVHAAVFYLGPVSFERWRELYFSATERQQDPEGTSVDGDAGGKGVPNLMRYALGMFHGEIEHSLFPRMAFVEVEGTEVPVIVYHRSPNAVDVEVSVEVSSDLRNWSNDEELFEVVSVEEAGSVERVVVRYLGENGSHDKRHLFMRLRIRSAETEPLP